MALGPFDWTGGPFLTLYIILLIIVIILGFVIVARLLPEGRSHRLRDPEQLALLAGGRARLADSVVTRLLASGALAMRGKDRLDIAARSATTAAEASVLALSAPLDWTHIERAIRPGADAIAIQLQTAGMMLTGGERANIRYWALLPYLMLIAFGATKWLIGDARERPIGYLTILLIATLLIALMRAFTIPRLTRAGRAALANAQAESDRVRRAPLPDEAGIAVALFGTAVLAGSQFDAYHRMRAASGDGGSGSSDSGDGGGGGGGGGGCGGCGS